jgi:hypothetical protein
MKKAIIGLVAVAAMLGLRPLLRRMGHQMRNHCEQMARQFCEQMAEQRSASTTTTPTSSRAVVKDLAQIASSAAP